MAIPHTKKNSVFVAIQQAALDFDSDGSEEERIAKEKKRGQKQKKNKSAKKSSNDNSLLQGLAMCSVSSKKKKGSNKASATKATTTTGQENGHHQSESTVEASPSVVVPTSPTRKPSSEAKSPAKVAKAAPKTPSADIEAAKKKFPITESTQPQNASSKEAKGDLGAIYAPTHITVTRADGKVSRQIAVAEMMDQLVRFQQQNTQLLHIQDQLGKTNRHLTEQLHHNAGVITSLQNEVAMFRQMCLTLQAEVTQLRSVTSMTQPQQPLARTTSNSQRPGPPPGMS